MRGGVKIAQEGVVLLCGPAPWAGSGVKSHIGFPEGHGQRMSKCFLCMHLLSNYLVFQGSKRDLFTSEACDQAGS